MSYCCGLRAEPLQVQLLGRRTNDLICKCAVENACELPSTDIGFGRVSAQSEDGTFLAVGAPLFNGHGAVYLFRRFITGTQCCNTPFQDYALQQLILPISEDVIDPLAAFFGSSLAFSASGHRLVIGDPAYNQTAGKAFVYDLTRCSKCFTLTDTLVAEVFDDGEIVPDTAKNFSATLAISGDGKVIAASAYFQAATIVPNVQGVYLYQVEVRGCQNQLKTFNFVQKIDIAPQTAMALVFSAQLSLTSNGNSLVIGTPEFGTITPRPGGSVRVYKRDNNCTSEWKSKQTITTQPQTSLGYVGVNVFITPNGKYLYSYSYNGALATVSVYNFNKKTFAYDFFEKLSFADTTSLTTFIVDAVMAVSNSGCFIAVNTHQDSIRIFQRVGPGATYVANANDVEPSIPLSAFGQGISLSGNGKVLFSSHLSIATVGLVFAIQKA